MATTRYFAAVLFSFGLLLLFKSLSFPVPPINVILGHFMEAIRVCLQEVIHSNCSPSCKASLFTKVAKQNAFTVVVALQCTLKLYFIEKCKKPPHV